MPQRRRHRERRPDQIQPREPRQNQLQTGRGLPARGRGSQSPQPAEESGIRHAGSRYFSLERSEAVRMAVPISANGTPPLLERGGAGSPPPPPPTPLPAVPHTAVSLTHLGGAG